MKHYQCHRDKGCILPCLLSSFDFWSLVLCFVSFITLRLLQRKKEPCPCMLGSKNTILPILSNTQTHTHTHTLSSVGDVFPALCMVQGDESTSLKYKVGLQGFTERTFFLSIVKPWMKGLHIKLAGLSSMLLDLLQLPIHYLLINVKSH